MEEQEKSEKQEVSVDSIRNECLDSPGYVVFAAVISKKQDAKGFNVIDYRYRRSNFSFEDVRAAVLEFKKAYEKDVEA